MTMAAQETADSLAEMTGAFARRRDAILAALLAERKAALAGVRVKPLVWPESCRRGQRVFGLDPVFRSAVYCIVFYGGDEGPAVYRVAMPPAGAWSKPYDTYEAAKAAAQADYEARILSALDLPPRSPNEQETES